MHSFFFLDANNGFAVGDGSLFLTTKDGGASWTPKDLGIPPTNLRSIRCATLQLCVMTTDNGRAIVRTDDGGATAKLITPSQHPIFAADFASPTRIVAGGATGATAVSDDAGLNFNPVGGRLPGNFSRVRAGGQSGTAFAPGDNGTLAKTTDGGRSWTRGNVSTSEDVIDVAFPTAQVGYALDSSGGLFRTNDGGATWRTLDTGTHRAPAPDRRPEHQDRDPRGPDRPAPLDRQRRHVLDRQRPRRRQGQAHRDRPRGQRAVRLRARATCCARPTSGKTWTPIHKPGRAVLVDFLDAKTGYFLEQGGDLWKTTDAGKKWTRLFGVGTERAYGMAFSSKSKGYLVIDRFGDVGQRGGFLLRTTDGGSDVASAVRRLHADPRRRDRGGVERDRLPARRPVEPAVHHDRRRGRQVQHAERHDQAHEAQEGRRDHGDRQAVAGGEQPARHGQLPGARLEPLAQPRRPRRRPTARTRRAGA